MYEYGCDLLGQIGFQRLLTVDLANDIFISNANLMYHNFFKNCFRLCFVCVVGSIRSFNLGFQGWVSMVYCELDMWFTHIFSLSL